MIKKGIYPCIWLLRGNAVRGFEDDTVLSGDPAALVRQYEEAGADGVLLFDLSKGDDEHEAAIGLIRQICENSMITVIGAGNIRRMEDVKKLIYAGCDLAALNLSKKSNRLLAREVCERFGKERIAGCCTRAGIPAGEWEKLSPWLSARILLDPLAGEPDSGDASSALCGGDAAGAEIPLIVCTADASTGAIAEQLKNRNVAAVTGTGVNRLFEEDGMSAEAVRSSLREAGFAAEEEQKTPPAFVWSDFKKGADGLLPVVVQEESTDQVLMVAYMNEEAYNRTVATGRMTYYSRSRRSLWVKGETSGHFQYVRSLRADCDMDTLLARVVQIGAACHTGSHSCFFNKVQEIPESRPSRMRARETTGTADVLRQDYQTILDRRDNPKEGSYTNYLFDKGIDKMLKKLGEENTEIVIAAKNPGENEIIYEIADYLYHLEVVMAQKGVDWDDITRELIRRQK
ncbi:MAG: bifunctional phosphoribosyl-AMP cyclohydrolase/phosphoribosyl-ATP diphosphatase HisIE [Eubacteriales bacterium]|nr:bifunctional phosphoribosyl-AMP cyclohydrolase/phosphoribosyl-ATP diphosphatase HisIE [Eubacteriales bacterium]